jgi:hypothetical protein
MESFPARPEAAADSERYARRAEAALACARAAHDEEQRRRLYLRAGVLMNLAYGGDRHAKGRAGYTY